MKLPFQTDATGARIYFRHLINGYSWAVSERHALESLLSRWVETWPHDDRWVDANRALADLRNGKMRGGVVISPPADDRSVEEPSGKTPNQVLEVAGDQQVGHGPST